MIFPYQVSCSRVKFLSRSDPILLLVGKMTLVIFDRMTILFVKPSLVHTKHLILRDSQDSIESSTYLRTHFAWVKRRIKGNSKANFDFLKKSALEF